MDKRSPAIAAGLLSSAVLTALSQAGSVAYVTDPHKWVIHGERLVDDTPHVRVSLADVELPNHVRFTQYVFRMRRCAMTVVLDDAGERVLMMRRHRFIVDRWVWELPGGYVDDGEDSVTAAAREVEEETGWRPRKTEFVMSSPAAHRQRRLPAGLVPGERGRACW